MLLAAEHGAIGVVVVNNRVSVGSVVKMNLGELTHRLDFKKSEVRDPDSESKIWYQQRSGLEKFS